MQITGSVSTSTTTALPQPGGAPNGLNAAQSQALDGLQKVSQALEKSVAALASGLGQSVDVSA